MRPLLIDTNAYAAFMKGDRAIIEVIQQANVIGISPIVLGELLGGFRCGNRTKKNEEELQQFLDAPRIKLFSISSDTAVFYSQIYFSLQAKGKPIPSNDIWIAAQALEHGCVLCTYDKNFKVIEGIITGTAASELFF